jgi:hypothetical protein
MFLHRALAEASAPAPHGAAASVISSKTQALRDQYKAWSLTASASCPVQPAVSRHHFQAASARSSGHFAAAPATIASWIEGSDLTEKPTPKGNAFLFYTHTLCPYAHRVHLALLEKARMDHFHAPRLKLCFVYHLLMGKL